MAGRNPDPVTRSDSAAFAKEAATVPYPPAPEHLTAAQAKHWDRIVRVFHAADLDATCLVQIEMACKLFPEIEKLTEEIASEGSILVGSKGLYTNPKINARKSLVNQCNQALRMVGFDTVKRYDMLIGRGIKSADKQSPENPELSSSSDSLFAEPVVESASARRRAPPVPEDFKSIYGRGN